MLDGVPDSDESTAEEKMYGRSIRMTHHVASISRPRLQKVQSLNSVWAIAHGTTIAYENLVCFAGVVN